MALRSPVMVTVQKLVEGFTESQPLQPEKNEYLSTAGMSVTLEPAVNGAEQVPGQAIPAGSLFTVPLPPPTEVIVVVSSR